MGKETKVVGVSIATLGGIDFSRLLISDYLVGGTKKAVFKINTEFLARAIREPHFKTILNTSDLNISDGRGVLWAARYLTLPITRSRVMRPLQATWQMIYSGAAIVLNPKFITYPISENIPGVDALKLMLGAAETTKSGVFFFGATQDDLDCAI
ncbi:MAG: hypothetical protein Q8912_05030, partial [Bacillota bacterium]|nr:hypothetical protein [Bacillota bacterium]